VVARGDPDGVITLASIDGTLTLAEVYRDPFKVTT
jgi:hypothetical protein